MPKPQRRPSPARKYPRKTESRGARIDALLSYAEKQFRDLSRSYDAALRHNSVPLELCIKIKNYCENLRSALDFLAYQVFEHCYPGVPIPHDLAFPLLWKRLREEAKGSIGYRFPDLKSLHPGVWREIERAQPYRRSNVWMRQFVRLVNDNKHWDLVAQRIRRAQVGSPEAQHLGPVVFRLEPEGEWVEYRFKGIDANAFLLLDEAFTYIRDIVYRVQVELQ